MSFYAKHKPSDFTPAPEGLHYSVCCDVVDLGIVKTSYQGQEFLKEMVRLVWQSSDKMTTGPKAGKPYMINRRYAASAHKKAALRIHCESWAGKAFTDEGFAAFDLERLIGKCCQIQIAHNVSGGETYANIMAIVPAPKGTPALKIDGYVRVKDRPGYVPPVNVVKAPAEAGGFDDVDHGDFPPIDEEDAPLAIPEDDIPF
jgi:hypothetical protein